MQRAPAAAAIASVLVCMSTARGQASSAVVPPVCAALPGNAALALPLRWSHGTLQVFVDAQLLPANFVGQAITGLWLRRPTLLGDVAYPAITRTLTVRGGFQPLAAAQMQGSLLQNRPANALVLFGPAPVAVAASAAPGPATSVGADLVHVVFTQPLPVVAGTLFLELETNDPPLMISTEHWVDGVWLPGGSDSGYAVTVGDGSCTTATVPTQLRWTGAAGPTAGVSASMELTGAPPTLGSSTGFVLAWVGLDPQTRAPGVGWLGYGASLALLDPTLAGCHQWAPFDASWFGPTSATGTFAATFPIPGSAALGTRLAVQAAWLDPARTGLPLSFSNGLMLVVGSAGVGNHCGTMFFPAGAPVSPWPLFAGQMPVLRLEY
jgi:hypothetical protein